MPEWLGIQSGFLGMKTSLVPLQGATEVKDGVQVQCRQDQVKDAPNVSTAGEISEEDEARLYQHYGINYSHAPSDTGLPSTGQRQSIETTAGQHHPDNAPETSMTRSEEELRVGKREIDAGQVRLRKYVETEPVSADVELRHETAEVERHPVNRPVRGDQIGEQEATVNLHAEEPVVQKEAVEREEVTLRKGFENETRTVSDEVRKERVEVEGDDTPQR